VKTFRKSGPAADTDESYMRRALAEARRAEKAGEVPVGAILVHDGKVFSRGRNASIRTHDPTAHAEIVALRRAGRKAKNYRLEGCALYVTLEPCAMCLGAAVQARIGRLVCGATDPKAGAVSSVMRFPFEKMNHPIEVKEGVLAAECAEILREFFRRKRAVPGRELGKVLVDPACIRKTIKLR